MNSEVDSILANLGVWIGCLVLLSTFAKPMLKTYNGSSIEDLERLIAESLGSRRTRIFGLELAPDRFPRLNRGLKQNFILVTYGLVDNVRTGETLYSRISILIREEGISYIMAFDE